MSSIAALKPVEVSDDPATLETFRSSRLLPTTSSAMPLANLAWYCFEVPFSASGVTSTLVILLSASVRSTLTLDSPPGLE